MPLAEIRGRRWRWGGASAWEWDVVCLEEDVASSSSSAALLFSVCGLLLLNRFEVDMNGVVAVSFGRQGEGGAVLVPTTAAATPPLPLTLMAHLTADGAPMVVDDRMPEGTDDVVGE